MRGTGASRDGVAQDETLERVGPVRLPVDHVHDLLLHALRLGVSRRPVVSRAAAAVECTHPPGCTGCGTPSFVWR